jgi:phospholipase C
MRRIRLVLALLYALAISTAALPALVGAQGSINAINHVVVIYQENWSFDSLYGYFPGANGLANAGDATKQVDKSGRPYATLPQAIDNNQKPPVPDPRFPAGDAAGRAVRCGQIRRPKRQNGRSRTPLLPGAVSDRRRQDG